MHPDAVTLRRARPDDIKALRTLQSLSLICLGTSHYAPEQVAAFITHVGTMDDHLVEDGGCLIAEIDGRMAGCGGWSLRTPGYAAAMGGAQAPIWRETPVVRSVFVHPGAARRGVGRRIMTAVEAEMLAAGHDRAVLTATLPGVAFYTALGWRPMRAVRLPPARRPRLPRPRHGQAAAPAAGGPPRRRSGRAAAGLRLNPFSAHPSRAHLGRARPSPGAAIFLRGSMARLYLPPPLAPPGKPRRPPAGPARRRIQGPSARPSIT